jgi:hypothetical protein
MKLTPVYRYTAPDEDKGILVWFDGDGLGQLNLGKTYFVWSMGGLNVALEEDTAEGGKQILEGLNLHRLFEEDEWRETNEADAEESGGEDSGGEYSEEEDIYG